MKNRTREIRTSGSVRDEDGNILIYSANAITKYGDGASMQAVTRVNAEQASKRTMHGPTIATLMVPPQAMFLRNK
jgi:hypothetical protein